MGLAGSGTLHELGGEGAAADPFSVALLLTPSCPRAGRAQQGRGPACLALQKVAGRGHGAAMAWPSPQQEAGCPPAPARCAAPQHGSRCPAVPGVPGLTQSLLLPQPSFTLHPPDPAGTCAGARCWLWLRREGLCLMPLSCRGHLPPAQPQLPSSLPASCAQPAGSLERSPPCFFPAQSRSHISPGARGWAVPPQPCCGLSIPLGPPKRARKRGGWLGTTCQEGRSPRGRAMLPPFSCPLLCVPCSPQPSLLTAA